MESKDTTEGGHDILYGDSFVAPTEVLISDSCPLGLPDNVDRGSHKHEDSTFWFQGPREGAFQKPWVLLGSLRLCGLLGP